MTAKEYEDSFYDLADKYGIVVLPLVEDPKASFSETTTRTVFVSEIKDELSYFIALHELGHIVNYDNGLHKWHPTRQDEMVEEARATEFALNYVPNPSESVATEALNALGSRVRPGDTRSNVPPEFLRTVDKLFATEKEVRNG